MKQFVELGETVECAWRKANYDERVLPAIAVETLEAAQIPQAISIDDVMRWLLTANALPEQEDLPANFGEPPVTVYRGRRFYVQVIFWMNGSTSIHQHGFAGAFQVLHGSSLHSRYAFDVRRRFSSRFLSGNVRLQHAELLGHGDIRPISYDLAHALFHLEAPSATIVIRTYGDSEAGPQYEYLPPYIAFDPFAEDPWLTRRLQGLALLAHSDIESYVKLAVQMIETSDLQTTYVVVEQAHRDGVEHTQFAKLMDAARRRHGDALNEIHAVLHESMRRRRIHRLRASIVDKDQRFFLALIQNLPNYDSIAALIHQREPSCDPSSRIREWAHSLSGAGLCGVDFEDPLNSAIFDGLLEGVDDAGLLERLARKYGSVDVQERASDLTHHIGRIRRTIFSPLFTTA